MLPSPFIARERDIERLEGLIDEALAGRGSALLLAGEPGIGKTRTAQELAFRARTRGSAVRIGLCDESGAAPAFWPWRQILRAELEDPRSAGLVSAPRYASVRSLALGAARARATPRDPEADALRFELFQGVVSFLDAASGERPRLLLVDDLHVADPSSVELLRIAARHLQDRPIAILATFRDVEIGPSQSAGEALARLREECPELRLAGLDETSVGHLLDAAARQPVTGALRRAIHRRTRGNPLFVLELARRLGEGGSLHELASTGLEQIPLPEIMRTSVARRLATLSRDAGRWLEIAAVAGRELDSALVARVLRASGTDTDGYDEVFDAGLVERSPHDPARVRFVHALVRDAIYDGLPLARRQHLHGAIGAELERSGAPDGGSHTSELAHHFARAGGGCAERALLYAVRAAEECLAQLAHEQAVAHFDRALRALESVAPPEELPERRRALLTRLGAAAWQAGDGTAARNAYREAAELARRAGSASDLAEAALGFAGRGEILREPHPGEVELLEEALAGLGPDAGALQVRLMARLARSVSVPGADPATTRRRDELSREAERGAEALGEPRALFDALHARHAALSVPGTAHARLGLATRMLDIARQLRSRRLELAARQARATDLLELGEGVAMSREIDTYAALARAVDEPFFLWIATGLLATRALLEGRYADAETLVSEANALGARAGAANAGPWYVVQLSALRRAQGRLHELEPAIRAGVHHFPAVPAYRIGLAFCLCESGRLDEAREAFDDAMADGLEDFPRDSTWSNVLSEAAIVCHHLGDRERAAQLLALMQPYDGLAVVCGAANACEGAVSHYLGLLAATLGRCEAAERHFEDAIALDRRLGARPYVARVRCDRAAFWLERNGPGDRERARAELARASRSFEALAMPAELGRAHALEAERTDREERAIDSGAGLDAVLPNALRLDGSDWTVTFEGRSARVRDTRGMLCLAALLADPGREIHALELIGGRRVAGRGAAAVLDARARREYRARLSELRAELAEAEERNDLGGRAAIRGEIEALERELATAFGLRGRRRRVGDPSERARKAVYNRIHAALARIDQVHPTLGRHLARSVRTGTFCCYDPERLLEWEVRAPRITPG